MSRAWLLLSLIVRDMPKPILGGAPSCYGDHARGAARKSFFAGRLCKKRETDLAGNLVSAAFMPDYSDGRDGWLARQVKNSQLV
jgi:hypothetical protein